MENLKIVFYEDGQVVKEFKFESRDDFEKIMVQVMDIEKKKFEKEDKEQDT